MTQRRGAQDAGDFLERLDNPYAPIPNEEVAVALCAAAGIVEKCHRDADRAEWDAPRRAYPEIPERVDPEIIDHDYREPVSTPQEDYLDSRKLLHHMMRLAFWRVGSGSWNSSRRSASTPPRSPRSLWRISTGG